MVDFHQSTEIHENAAHRLCDLSARACHKLPELGSVKGSKRERQVVPKVLTNESVEVNGLDINQTNAAGINSMDDV
jgi:hypothetical protein